MWGLFRGRRCRPLRETAGNETSISTLITYIFSDILICRTLWLFSLLQISFVIFFYYTSKHLKKKIWICRRIFFSLFFSFCLFSLSFALYELLDFPHRHAILWNYTNVSPLSVSCFQPQPERKYRALSLARLVTKLQRSHYTEVKHDTIFELRHRCLIASYRYRLAPSKYSEASWKQGPSALGYGKITRVNYSRTRESLPSLLRDLC